MFKRIGSFVSMAILIAAVLSAPVQASADPGYIATTGEDVFVFTVPNVRLANGTMVTANCTTVPSPAPVFSGSGGGTAHWGAKTTCDRVANIKLTAWVVNYINGYEYPADDRPPVYATNTYASVDAYTQCVGFTPTQWQVKFVPLVNGLPGSPPQGQSAIRTLTCE